MEEEQEMCQICKRDIPVANYRNHTLHCKRNATVCPDCHQPVSKTNMEQHFKEAHSLKICDQCGISVEARKLHDHRTALCSKILIVCKYCEEGVPASSLSEHEQSCADGYDQCAKCFEWVQRREWDEHQGTLHNLLVQRSPMRQRRQSESSSQPKPAEVVDASTMLPCEFCEGLVPFTKLLEHQAECVNPTNVRGSAGLRSPLMQPRFGGTLARSQSVLSYEGHGERSPRPTRVDRSSSVRESTTSRASEEPRMSTRLLLRQSSFTERSIRRRSESLTRQSSFTDRSYIRRQYYSSSTRRGYFDGGYSGYATYNSINQGLDDITYGGRLSRRNSFNDGSRRGSVTNLSHNDLSYPTLMATYEATKVQHEHIRRKQNESRQERDNEITAQSIPVVQQPLHQKVQEQKQSVAASPLKPTSESPATPTQRIKLQRKVSFTEKDPVIINDTEEPMTKPRKKKEKVVRRKKLEKDVYTGGQERRRSHPVGDQLFEQVSSKLKALEVAQTKSDQQVRMRREQQQQQSAFGDLDSGGCSVTSSKEVTSTEASPKQKQRNRNSLTFVSQFTPSGNENRSSPPMDFLQSSSAVRLRNLNMDSNSKTNSKSSSKRNSLDSKSVQGLAQDLAQECAKAYALMESSLSKLAASSSNTFGLRSKKSKRTKEQPQQ